MSELQEFVGGILERHGAVVEDCAADGLDVLSPPAIQRVMRWREFERLDFRGSLQELSAPAESLRIGLEGDWLERFGGLLGDCGHWTERVLALPDVPGMPNDPERMLGRVLDLPNAVWRLQGHRPATARCLVLCFRYTAVSDEKREGLIWLGFNQSTGAAIDSIVARLLPAIPCEAEWRAPDAAMREGTQRWNAATLETRLRPLLEHRVRQELDPFLHAMRRRLERDRARVHAYHDELWASSQTRLSVLADSPGEKAEAGRRRERLRIAAVEREYRNKLADLAHNYALRVSVEWVQALELYVPVQRFDLVIRRRKGERRIALDWHPLARAAEPPLCDWGAGLDGVRLACDDKLHLTEPQGQSACTACGKPFCRACHTSACPRCAATGG